MTEVATLGGGCFWCLEAAYLEIEGITGVVNGYSGGVRENPTYDQVCSGATGHAEVVEVSFDTEVITYDDVLSIFFAIHNPTTKDRQGHDVGSQYRSIIFYATAAQQATAQAKLQEIATLWPDPIVTELVPLVAFYKAEEYHQNYFRKNPTQGYCQAIINPKLVHLREVFRSRLKA
jgi:peptide-methionine (S)-S-oxide reductase